ncbi:unnamed protein product [Diamesa serratosioi]
MWTKLFEPEIIEDHLRKLVEHVGAFYKEIIVETQVRENLIAKRIEKLNNELTNLKRLLKEDTQEVGKNVPLYTLQLKIDEGLEILRVKLERRHQLIESYLIEQEEICKDLGEEERSLEVDPLPSDAEMLSFRHYLDELQCKKLKRLEEINKLRLDINSILISLEITQLDEYDAALLHHEAIRPTRSNIIKLQEVYHSLNLKLNSLSAHITDMRNKLQSLWKYCDVPERDQKRFANYVKITQTTYEKLFAEIERCEQIKRENLKLFITKVREEIIYYWDKCMTSQAERIQFINFQNTIFNEDALELHEDILVHLKTFYENNKEIFQLYNERKNMWGQIEEMINKENDPKRFNNRGGQLLTEEKNRKIIATKLPKIEARLIDMVNNYEMQNNKPFTVDGVRIQDIIERDYETKNGKKVAATVYRSPYRANITGTRTPLTIERTIINRTSQMKSTQMRLAPTPRIQANASSIRSVTKSNGKRKLSPMVTVPQSKRKLLSAFVSPSINNNLLKPVNNSVARPLPRKPLLNQPPSLKVYNIGSVIKRRSKSRKSMSKKRNSSLRQRAPTLTETNTTQDITLTSNTTSYEGFKNYVVKNKGVSRSSEIQNNCLRVNHHAFASPLIKKQKTPTNSPTPNKNLLMGTPSASTPRNKGQQPKDLEFSIIISNILREVADISRISLDELSKMWTKLFEPEIIEDHLRKLVEHVGAFYKEIIVETQVRENLIAKRIEKLNNELTNLKRLLKEDTQEVGKNVPLYTLQLKIDEGLEILRVKLERRHQLIESYLIEQEEICKDLGEEERSLEVDPLPSDAEMLSFRHYLDELQCKKLKRLEEINKLRLDINSILISLEITQLDEYDAALLHHEAIRPTRSNIIKLQEVYHSLNLKLNSLSAHITDMRNKLQSLWKYCDVPERDQKRFANYVKITQTTYEKLFAEIERCEQIKRENLKLFITKVREEIIYYWDKCMTSQAERIQFINFQNTIFNEDALELHEDILVHLKTFYENNKEIFQLYNERKNMWGQIEEMINKENDPKRFNNRGGQLLTEEKNRKIIATKLPKIEARLIDMVNNYEMQNNKPFTVDGVRIQDIIERDYETKSGKKVAATVCRTPYRANITGTRTPLTIEQTIINRTSQMKSTQMRLAPTPRIQANATTSSNASSIRSVAKSNGKRKLSPMVKVPQSKRKLLSAFVSPSINNNLLKPVNNRVARPLPRKPLLNQPPSLKVYNIGSVIKRRSKSRKSMSKKRNSSLRQRAPTLTVTNTTQDINLTSNTTSYEGFQNYVVKNKGVSRSSEIQNNCLRVNHHAFASPLIKKQKTPTNSPTPNKNLLMGTPSASTPRNKGQQPKDLEFSIIM